MQGQAAHKKKSGFLRIRNRILVGILLATPIVATVWIFKFLLNVTTAWFPERLIEKIDIPFKDYLLPLIVLFCIFIVFYILGFLVQNFFGKKIYQLTDSALSRIPIIRNIYIFVRQLCEWVAKSHSTIFNKVVLVEYPRKGVYVIGLVTSETQRIISSKICDENGAPIECVNVFIATTPNPTSGVYIIVPKKDIVQLDMDVNTAANQIVSAGAILPEQENEAKRNPLMELISKFQRDEDETDN
jgi:uncharacterized membrane protein